MALTVAANAPLAKPALRILGELHLASSFPYTFPITWEARPGVGTIATTGGVATITGTGTNFGGVNPGDVQVAETITFNGQTLRVLTIASATSLTVATPAASTSSGAYVVNQAPAPLRFSTHDIIAQGSALGAWLFEGRLLEAPALTLATSGDVLGVQEIEQVQLLLANGDGALTPYLTSDDLRGKLVRLHRINMPTTDPATWELTANIFNGIVAAYTFTSAAVSLLATSLDVGGMSRRFPVDKVNTADFPFAVDVGEPISWGWGIGERLPCRWVQAPNGEGDNEFPGESAFCVGAGNLGVWHIAQGGATTTGIETLRVDPASTLVGGRYVTLLRDQDGAAAPLSGATQGPVRPVASVVRLPDMRANVVAECDWFRGFQEKVGRQDPFPGALGIVFGDLGFSDISTGALVQGYHPVGLGAVRFDGVNDYLQFPNPDRFALQTFTLQFCVCPEAVLGTLITGPNTTNNYGWRLEWRPADFGFTLYWSETGTSYASRFVGGEQSGRRWFMSTIIKTPTSVKSYTGTGTAAEAAAGPIVYSPIQRPLLLGSQFNGNGRWFRGRLGWFRITAGALTEDEVGSDFYMLERNGINALRDVCDRVRWPHDGFTTARNDWGNVANAVTGGHHLRCDGYVTQQTQVREAIQGIARMRGVRLSRGADGRLGCTIAKAATSAVGTLEVGGELNDASLAGGSGLSTAEALRELVLEYRQVRDENGGFSGFALEQSFPVLPFGREADPDNLPFVWDSRSAQICGQFLAADIRAKDRTLSLIAGHEARQYKPGDVVSVVAVGAYNRPPVTPPSSSALSIPFVTAATNIGTIPNGATVLAKDCGASCLTSAGTRYVFGDTLGPTNPDGTLVVFSTALSAVGTPLAPVTQTSPWQPLAFTPAEALWNIQGVSQHSYRFGMFPFGLVPNGSGGSRVFLAIDQPLYSTPPGTFYGGFPIRELHAIDWPVGTTTLSRDPNFLELEWGYEWPTGFFRLPSGEVRFFIQESIDGEPVSNFRRGSWTVGGGFVVESTVAFRLSCSLGVSIFWHPLRAQWLCAYIEWGGVLKINTLDLAAMTIWAGLGRFAYQIPVWAGNWDGYAAVHCDGADDPLGKYFHIVYSRIFGFLSGDLPLIKVEIL